MHLKSFLYVCLSPLQRPQVEFQDLYWCWWVIWLEGGVPAAPVPDHGADLDARNGLLLDPCNEPSVDVLLCLPLKLVLADGPSTCKLVVGDDGSRVGVLLQVDCTAQGDAIDLCV